MLASSSILLTCVSLCLGQGGSFEESAPAPAASVPGKPRYVPRFVMIRMHSVGPRTIRRRCVAATSVNADLLHFRYSLSDFGSHVFSSETACTASEEVMYLSLTNMTVPVEELQSLAIKTWQAPNSIGAQIQNVTYFNLETGRIVYGDAIYDWNRDMTYFNYSVLIPNIADMPAYQQRLLQLNYTVSNLTTGITPSRRCQTPIPQLQGVSDFVNSVLTKNVSNVSSLDGGLRPTELRLLGGCISESNTNYAGTVLQEIRTGNTSQVRFSTSFKTCVNDTECRCSTAKQLPMLWLTSMLAGRSEFRLTTSPMQKLLNCKDTNRPLSSCI